MKGIRTFIKGNPARCIIQSVGHRAALFRRVVLLLIAFSLILAGCVGEATSVPAPTPKPLPTIENTLTATERLEIFEAVWQTVNDKFYDPAFGGKDWGAIGDAYRQNLAAVQDDHTFWLQVLNTMLFELGVSHLAALPPELSSQLDSITFSTGTLGMNVRLLDGKPVVTQVDEASPAEEAGIRPGFVITAVDGLTLEAINAEGLHTPPNNERNQRGNIVQGMRRLLYGETGKEVVIDYLDANDHPGRATLQFIPRSGVSCGQIDPALPPACVEIVVNRLSNGIGYLRFSGFLEPALEGVLQAIDDFHDIPALIIDLRGNPGGQFPVRKAIASHLVGEPKLFMRYQLRDKLEEAYLDPVTEAYPGEVIILVDELSASSNEEFAGSLQALGRATIIGAQTPGRCLVMNIEPLPKGAMLVYPFGQSQTPDGRVLEDNGVLPDIEVALVREELLQGIDAQLEAAIEFIAEQ